MIKKIKKWTFLSLLCSAVVFHAQGKKVSKGDLIDGIAAVVGNEIVLESDIQEQMNYAQQQGVKLDNKCEFMTNLINNKLMIYQAKKDTLIEARTEAIKEMADQKYSQILSQFSDEKTMLKAYGFRTPFEMKKTIEKMDTDNYYAQEKYRRVTSGMDITPNEVTDFYNIYKFQLPEVKDEVSLAQIVKYPKLTPAHKQELIDKLKNIKKEIEGGESFEKMARIYSEDPGSASNGGLYTKISKGRMVKQFEAAALNLQEGEISQPVESEFGFHLIQLVKKSGKFYDARHILLSAKPNKEEIAQAKKELEDIKKQIQEGKLTFKEAVYRFSDDKTTKFSAGIISAPTGGDKIEKVDLPATLAYQIAGLNKGDFTDVFENEENNKISVNLVLVNEVIEAHQLDLSTDYERIKLLALDRKKKEKVDSWLKEQLPDVFLHIDKKYKDCVPSMIKK